MPTKQPFESLVVQEEAPVEWQLDIPRSIPESISSSVFTNHGLFTPEQCKDSLLIVKGYGEQQDWVTVKILAALAILKIPGIVIGVGIDQTSSPDNLSLESYAHQSIGKILLELQERELTGSGTNAVGHSMGGALLGIALKEFSGLFGDLGFEEPVAHDTAARKISKPDDIDRKKEFSGEFTHVMLGPYRHVPMTEQFKAAGSIASQLRRDIFPISEHRLSNSFGIATMLDAGPYVLEHAAKGNKVAYVFGIHDPLVKHYRTYQSLGLHAVNDPRLQEALGTIKMHITDQKHSYMGWDDGINHLKIVTGLLDLHDIAA